MTHNTFECCHFNKNGTPIKRDGGAGTSDTKKPHSKERGHNGTNFAQIIQAGLKKELHK